MDVSCILLYLYNGKCITECPNGTFADYETNMCINCDKNCESCSECDSPSNMNCNSCSENQIIYDKGCYEIYNDSIKSLYKPENDLEITSCKESFWLYL